MRTIITTRWSTTLATALALCFGVTLSTVHQDAFANGYKSKASAEGAHHKSILRISDSNAIPVEKTLKIGLGKSMLVEFPRDIRDVMVSNPQVVDAVVLSTNRVFLLARKIGEANAFFFDSNGDQFATFELFVERDTNGLQAMLNRLIPGSNINVEMLNSTVVLTGSVRAPADSSRASQIARTFVNVEFEVTHTQKVEGTALARVKKAEGDSQVINLLAVDGKEQVMLRVVVAEVQRTILKQFGVNLGAAINSGNFTTAVLTENALPLTAGLGLGSLPIPGIATATVAGAANTTGQLFNFNGFQGGGNSNLEPFGNSGISGAWGTGNQQISGALRALERDGLIRTLAEPNLTAVSGEPAKFLAGGEFPIPTVDSQGRIGVEFKEFGVGVSFTPLVLSEGRISLKIETEVSELSNNGAVQLNGLQIPAIQTRRANSTVELPSGGTLAIAGLLSENSRQNIDGFPGLKDLPILGTLFRSRDFVKEETEMLVIVTPYIVKPTARKNLARPGDGLSPAVDRKANFLGHMNRIYGREHTVSDGGLKGDYGFIVE